MRRLNLALQHPLATLNSKATSLASVRFELQPGRPISPTMSLRVLLTSPQPGASILLEQLLAALRTELGWDTSVVLPEEESSYQSRCLDVNVPIRVKTDQKVP